MSAINIFSNNISHEIIFLLTVRTDCYNLQKHMNVIENKNLTNGMY